MNRATVQAVVLGLFVLLSGCGSNNSATTYTVSVDKAVGNYGGTWTNQKFNSTGAATAVVTKNTDGSAHMVVTLGGNALGESSPSDTFDATTTTTTGTLTAKSSTSFGSVTGTLKNDGTWTFAGTNNPGGGSVKSYNVTATYDANLKLTTTATITFTDNSTATSVGTLTKSSR